MVAEHTHHDKMDVMGPEEESPQPNASAQAILVPNQLEELVIRSHARDVDFMVVDRVVTYVDADFEVRG